jgi:hypothetical protein
VIRSADTAEFEPLNALICRDPRAHADERAMYDRLGRWLCGSGEADEVALGVGEVGDHQI